MSVSLPQPGMAPIQRISDPVFKAAGIEVSVLRLDLLHPVISGNKWMKLLPWLNLVKENNMRGILTKGGPFSNHIHAASYAAFRENIACTLVIKAKNGMMTPTLEDVAAWNANIIYAPDDYDKDEKWVKLATVEQLFMIPMGGEGPEAAKSVKSFLEELKLAPADHIICPVGTGTTLAGIAATPIFRKSLTGINPGINNDYENLVQAIQENNNIPVSVIHHPILKKFGKWPEFLPALMNEWYGKWQLPTDIVYTAKMFYVLFEMIKENRFRKGDSIMLVHTGGLQGNRSLPSGTLIF
jgi:1-aminocyclopropane-1-carboxylate deaminase/D-cysteine desulfhydrase-like pyridoxal-dependent ACC family enzyme